MVNIKAITEAGPFKYQTTQILSTKMSCFRIVRLRIPPVINFKPEVPNVVLKDEDDLFDGGDALVGLAGPVQIVDSPT